MAFEYGSATTEEHIMAQLTSIADLKESELENWFEHTGNDVELIARYSRIADYVEGHEENAADLPELEISAIQLFKSIDTTYSFKRISIIDNFGEVLLSTNPEYVGTIITDKYATNPLITKETYIQDIFKTSNGNFSMIFSAPIFSFDNETYERTNEVIGALIIEIDMAESLYPMIERWPAMGNTGETVLVRREGNEIVFINKLKHLNESPLSLRTPINSTNALPAIRSSGGEEGIMRTKDYMGEEVLSAYRHIDLPNWGFVAKIDEKEAFAGIDELRNQIIGLSIILILLAFGMAIWLSTTITRPIIYLEELTKKVAQGDFSEYPKVTSNDEIGSLTKSFVKMETDLARSKRELEDYSENLQHKVDEKTSELVESEERFRTMIDQAPLGIALINSLTGYIYEVNSMFAKIAGRTKEQMSTIDWMAITHPDDIQKDLDNMALLNAGKINGFQMEKRYIHPDGSFVWINMTIAPVKVKDKTQPRHLCMIEDINERKQTKDLLQSTTDYLNKLIDYTNAPFVVWDPEFRIIKVNHAFERLTGYNSDEIVNTELPMYFPKESRQQSMDNVKRASRGEYWESVEMSILQKDGNVRYMMWNSANLYNKDGETVSVTIAQGIDISERKNLMDEIRQMNIDLEEKVEKRTSELTAVNKELEAFSYSVSHDLRAPLRSVDGFSQALLEDYGDKFDETGTDYLNRVRNATKDMGHLIDDLLNLSRITRGEVDSKEVDLSELVSDIVERYKTEEPDRQMEFAIEKGVKANGDEKLLRAMFENLMSNAYKFSSKEPIAKIEFGLTRINNENVYFIRDNGVGFDMKYADKLFGAFQRLHSKAEFPGTGVGLATVQRIIHKHGGNIWAESELGKGATFYFTL